MAAPNYLRRPNEVLRPLLDSDGPARPTGPSFRVEFNPLERRPCPVPSALRDGRLLPAAARRGLTRAILGGVVGAALGEDRAAAGPGRGPRTPSGTAFLVLAQATPPGDCSPTRPGRPGPAG